MGAVIHSYCENIAFLRLFIVQAVNIFKEIITYSWQYCIRFRYFGCPHIYTREGIYHNAVVIRLGLDTSNSAGPDHDYPVTEYPTSYDIRWNVSQPDNLFAGYPVLVYWQMPVLCGAALLLQNTKYNFSSVFLSLSQTIYKHIYRIKYINQYISTYKIIKNINRKN